MLLAHLPARLPAAVELYSVLSSRLDAMCRELTPQQMAGALWACTRTSHYVPRVAGIGMRHLSIRLADYSACDAICVLWACAQLGVNIPGEQQQAGGAWLPLWCLPALHDSFPRPCAGNLAGGQIVKNLC